MKFRAKTLKWCIAVVTPVFLIATLHFSGFFNDVVHALALRLPEIGTTAPPYRDGVASLEENILKSDVIVVAELKGTNRGVGAHKFAGFGYSKTLEFNFQVVEYLKGDGSDEVTGLVFDADQGFKTKLGAQMGNDIDPDRYTAWDDRRAVLFLRDDGKDPDISRKNDHYWLGRVGRDGPYADQYSLSSWSYRPWLPATEDDDSIFLLEPGGPAVISLSELQDLIAELGQKTAGQSEEYNNCLYESYKWEREVAYARDEIWDGGYYYFEEHYHIDSGLPFDTRVYTTDGANFWRDQRKEDPAAFANVKYVLAGQDPEYFYGAFPGEIFTTRPLPAGEYRIFHAWLPGVFHACGATVPKDEMGRKELFVHVSAPKGTLHETFFDPIAYAAGIGAPLDDGPIIVALWEESRGGAGTLRAVPTDLKSMAGQTLEFIALDGSTQLSLAIDEATASKGSLTWDLKEQPWHGGDKLMLRVSA